MCGIAGLYRADGGRLDTGPLIAMREAIGHRGPDGHGVFVEGPVGLAHRRLAIIDLVTGEQPMRSPDGRLTVVFNGEIYNFKSLRAELQRAGWTFRTASDTEVLLAGYAIWGAEALVKRLDGIFAFALWDRQHERLILARDRYGAKPLYLWRTASGVAFASEIKALMAHPDFSVRLNRSALREYFTFQNLFRSHTLFAGVEQLPPATLAVFEGGGEQHIPYWRFDFSATEPIDAIEAEETLRRLLLQGVDRQLVSDVPLGAYLSGGMDSASLVAAASRRIPRLPTFTAGFEMSDVTGPEAGFDERRAAETVALRYKTQHYEQVINAGDVRWALPRVVWHLEDLRLGMSYPNFYIAGLASRFVKVCLSGAGGDELFGGYPWRYYRIFRSLDRNDYLRNYYGFWQRLTSASDRREMFGAEAGDEEEMFGVFSSVYDDQTTITADTAEDHIANALFFECKTFLSGLLLVGDKLSMASGLEERFPFLDNDVVDFAMRLPVRHKLGDLEAMLAIDEDAVRKKLLAEEHFSAGKTVLRRAMAGLLPAEIMQRRKQGFSSPEASWYRGENANYVRELLFGSDLAMSDYIDPGFVRRKVDAHMSGDENNRLLIWSFLSFEWWCRIFLNGERPHA
jgi:asparagine synthase (glutamine-hydrolysing)